MNNQKQKTHFEAPPATELPAAEPLEIPDFSIPDPPPKAAPQKGRRWVICDNCGDPTCSGGWWA